MRTTKVVSISLPAEMLAAAQKLAAKEQRTMSELMREAFRLYQREQKEWADIFAYGAKQAKKAGVRNEQDVVRIVREERRKIAQEAAKAAVSGKR